MLRVTQLPLESTPESRVDETASQLPLHRPHPCPKPEGQPLNMQPTESRGSLRQGSARSKTCRLQLAEPSGRPDSQSQVTPME